MFLCKAAQERGGGLVIHTSGLNCDWLKAINVEEVSHIFSVLQL